MKRLRDWAAVRPALTPLIDVAFLVLIFFMALPLRRLDHKLQAELPEQGMDPTVQLKPPAPKVAIRVLRRGEEHLFRIGDQIWERPVGMEPVLRRLGPDNVYQVHASMDVSWDAVVQVVDLLTGLEYTRVEFRGGTLLPGELRRRR